VVAAPGARGWFGRRHVEVTAAAERPLVSDDRHAERGGHQSDSPFETGRARKREQRAVASLTAQLQATGLDASLAHDVATAHPTPHRRGATVHSLRKTLAAQLATLAAEDEGYAPVEVFVGPPGVGKTTTIAKIASQARARGGTRLGLVAADGFRVGAVEQLRLYADILGTPLTVARTPHDRARAIEDARRPLLIDTAGRSPHDDVSREMLRVVSGRTGVRTHLVLAASTPADLVRRTLGRFADARPSRLVITKLDEAESLAPIVGVLREQQIPISYLGTGQSVPEDLERATSSVLAAWVAGDVCHGGAV
jgi:flagellar biosynthesis protein FlhF